MTMALIATVRDSIVTVAEIGMSGDKDKGDADIRFPGGWLGDENNAFTKERPYLGQNQYFDFTSKLFQWRKTNEAVHLVK
jgi:hypothetical protein